MVDLFWPGDHRAGWLMADAALLDACLRVEAGWSGALVAAGLAPQSASLGVADLRALLDAGEEDAVAVAAEAAGTPVVPLVRLLRGRLDARGRTDAGRWLHRGLTSQDVLDTALLLCARDAVRAVVDDLGRQVGLLVALVREHRRTPMLARTLTQPAVPTTFGFRAAQWLTGVLDAHDDAVALRWPMQLGGAGGTMAAAVELAGHRSDPVAAVTGPGGLADGLARHLDLEPSPPWHTVRSPVTRLGDGAVRCTDVWARLAHDVLVQARAEVGELAEGVAGGSSTMPHKANPVLATLVRRAGLAAPALAATLHLAAADSGEERPAGAWHVEWATLRTLLRRTVVAGSQTTDLLRDLRVRPEQMAAHLLTAGEAVRSEQRVMADLVGRAAAPDYLGAADVHVDRVLARAARTTAGDAR